LISGIIGGVVLGKIRAGIGDIDPYYIIVSYRTVK